MTNTHFDFGDGNGPVPAHRHPNGGGWVADTAKVYETSYVGPDAQVYDDATVSGNARVYDNAKVSGDACVSGDAWVAGDETEKELIGILVKDRIFINGKWYVEEVEDDE